MVDWIGLYLQEDLGAEGVQGDRTSRALLAGHAGAAALVFREPGMAAGLRHAVEVFRRLGATAHADVEDGALVQAGTRVLRVKGPADSILAGERLALNIVARMSGIATRTRQIQDRLDGEGSRCRVAGTRKTTPGFRVFEKEAIALGGGDPHRMGLFDALMVKDNHRASSGYAGVADAARRLRQQAPGLELEVEVESLEDAVAAARAGADWVLIDNQDPETGRRWADAVRSAGASRVEASGGIKMEDVQAYAWADRVSLGALTMDVRSVDVSLEWEEDART